MYVYNYVYNYACMYVCVTAIDNHDNTVVGLDMAVYFFGNINNRNRSSKSSSSKSSSSKSSNSKSSNSKSSDNNPSVCVMRFLTPCLKKTLGENDLKDPLRVNTKLHYLIDHKHVVRYHSI